MSSLFTKSHKLISSLLGYKKPDNTINQLDSQGKPHGVWEDYWKNGKVRRIRHYYNGKEHGVWEQYNANGTLFIRGQCHHGTPHGVWEWYKQGKITYKEYCLNIR